MITAAPSEFLHGRTATVTTDREVSSFALVRMSSTTHTVQNDQRRLSLSFTRTGTNQYALNIPSNSGYLLPGYWMLFAMDANGVPSVSKTVRVATNTIARMVSPDPISTRVGIQIGVQPQITKLAGTVSFGGTGLPPGVTVNPTTGYVSGAPTAAGSYFGQLTATDGTRTVSVDLSILVDQISNGTGLLAEYYGTTNLTGATLAQKVEGLDFTWTSSPGGAVPATFSARWSGTLVAMRSGPTTLRTLSDDGVRLWADGRLLIDNWTSHATVANDAVIDLVAGQSYRIEVNYNNTGGPGRIALQWQRPGDTAFSAVPATQLFPAAVITSANVAAGKPATQSTTHATTTPASAAVDGSATNGKYSHTLNAANEWWQVDLGGLQQIDRIRLWNRADCCQTRLSSFVMMIATSDLTGRSYAALMADATVIKRSVGATNIPSTIDIPGGVSGRFVRVQMSSAEYLHLAEVEVFGRPINNPPSIVQPSTQVSTIGANVSLAVSANDPDGNPLTYSASGLPPGLAISNTTGQITGVISGTGSFRPTVRATDPGGLFASASFTWSVADVMPSVTSLPVAVQVKGTDVTYQPVISNGTGVTYSWSFGDGTATTSFSASPAVTHRFATAGIFPVSLIMRNSSGSEYVYRFDQAIIESLPAAAAGDTSSSLAFEPRTGASSRLWVANRDNNTVAVIDLGTNTRIAEIPVGIEPVTVARHPNGTIWVVNRDSATISFINPATFAVTTPITLPRGSRPWGLVFAGATNDAYFTFEATGQLAKAQPDGWMLGWVYAGRSPRFLATNAARTRIYVSSFITPPMPGESTATVTNTDSSGRLYGGEVRDFDLSRVLQRTFTLKHSERQDTEISARGIPNYLGAGAVSPDGKSLWIPSKQDNIKRGLLRDGQALDFQTTVRAIISRIDLETGTEDIGSRIDVDNSGLVSAIAFHPTGAYMFAALQTSREVAVIDPALKREVFRFTVGRAPSSLTISLDGNTLYVGNFMDRSVSVIDLVPLVTRGQKIAPARATIPTVGTEKLSAAVLKGKQFFYDAADTRLARDGYLSCAVCHDSGDADGRVWDFTGFGEGLRNTISLEGRGGMGNGFLHWSANFDEVQDFEGQIRSFAGGSGLMSDADFNAADRSKPLGAPKAGLSPDLDALAAYVASRTMAPKSPYRKSDGTMTAQALSGKSVFTAKGCGTCHAGTAMTMSGDGSQLKNIGTINSASGKRLGGALNGIDVPTLRGVWRTAPYLHNGSRSLEGAVRAHSGMTVTDAEMPNLLRYLQEIEQEP